MIELQTNRLVLRQWRDEDLDGLAAIDGDPEVMRYIGDGSVRDREQTSAAIDNMTHRWLEQGFGIFAAEHAGTGNLVGWVGLAIPTFLPEVLPAVEIGWRLGRNWWGQGLATEGARAVLADGFGRCGLEELVSIRHEDNLASGRVMEKLGFRFVRSTMIPAPDRNVIITALSRTDYDNRSSG